MKKIIIAASFALLLSSCTDKDDTMVVEQIQNTAAFHNLFSNELENQTQAFHMNAEDGEVTFFSAHGVMLSIDGSCLKLNGQPVTGAVDIEFVEIFDRGTMLVTNKETMGLYNNEKHLLDSGGEFYINATQNGQQLTLDCSMQIKVPTYLTGGTDDDMMPFIGTLDATGSVLWESVSNGEQWNVLLGEIDGIPTYNAILDNFGWFNCDRFMNPNGPNTTITPYVPAGYNNSNSHVFLAVRDNPNTLGSTGGYFPVGLECHLIFVSENDGEFYYAIKENQILEGIATNEFVFTSAELQTATAAELVAIINALP